MQILIDISEKLQRGRAKDVSALVTEALTAGVDPQIILNEGLIAGMNIVGEKFEKAESEDIMARIEKNVSECLASLKK